MTDLVQTTGMSQIEIKGFLHMTGPQRQAHLPGDIAQQVFDILRAEGVTGILILRGEPSPEHKFPNAQFYRHFK